MTTEWRPLPEVARAAGVPESTARRHAKGVARDYLPTQAAGRFVLYDLAVAVPVLRRVAELFRRGQSHAHVADALAREFQPVVELEAPDAVVAVERHQPPQAPDAGWPAVLREVLTACNALRAELDQERAARVALEGKLSVMEVELVTAKRRAREFERVVESKLVSFLGRIKGTEKPGS